MVALGGGVLAAATAFGAFKALIGAGGIFGGVALKGSALALDGSAEALTSAAIALGGHAGLGGHGPGRSPTGPGGLRMRAGMAGLSAADILANAPSD